MLLDPTGHLLHYAMLPTQGVKSKHKRAAKMKEQIKTPEKELNKMEISNLSGAEFKTLVIRIPKELIGYFKSIKEKNTQVEMKVILSEI